MAGEGKEAFGRALVAAREARGYSQAAFSRKRNVSQSAVSYWEAGVNAPSPDVVFDIERELALEPGTLSRHLGYVPVANGNGNGRVDDFVALVLANDRLDALGRKALIAMFEAIAVD